MQRAPDSTPPTIKTARAILGAMANRDNIIRQNQDAMLQAFSHTELEKQYFRPFLVRSMQIACGFKVLFESVVGRECDIATDLKNLDQTIFESLTENEIQEYCSGKRVHPDVQTVINCTTDFRKKGKKPDDYEQELEHLKIKHEQEKRDFVDGLEASDKALGALKEAIMRQTRQIEEIVSLKPRIVATTQYTNLVGVHASEVLQLKTQLTEQLRILMRIVNEPDSTITGSVDGTVLHILEDIKKSMTSGGGADPAQLADLSTQNNELQQSVDELAETLGDLKSKVDQWVEFHQKVYQPLLQTLTLVLSTPFTTDTDQNDVVNPTMRQEINHLGTIEPATQYALILTDPVENARFQTLTQSLTQHIAVLENLTKMSKYVKTQWAVRDIDDLENDMAPNFSWIIESSSRNGHPLSAILSPLMLSCVPPNVYYQMITAQLTYLSQKPNQNIDLSPFSSTVDLFTGLVFHIEDKAITPCTPDINHPFLHAALQSYLNLLISEANNNAAAILVNSAHQIALRALESLPQTQPPQQKLKRLMMSTAWVLPILEPHSPPPIKFFGDVKFESDGLVLAFLLQLEYIIRENPCPFVLTYKDRTSGTLNLISGDDIRQLHYDVLCMICNLDSIANATAGIGDTQLDQNEFRMLMAFGFDREESIRACGLAA
jgi:hypothetical protein